MHKKPADPMHVAATCIDRPDFHIGKHRVTWARVPDDDTVRFQAWTCFDEVYVRARCVPSRTNVEMFRDFVRDLTTEQDLDDIIAEFTALIATADDVREARP